MNAFAKFIAAAAAVMVVAIVGYPFLAGGSGSGVTRPTQATLPAPPFGLAANGVIALANDGDILVADRPGGDTRPLVAGPEDDRSPMFSPDGTRLAFHRDTELGSFLMVADADGTNVVQIPLERTDLWLWSFAPDGQSLIAVGIDGEKRVVIRPVDPAAALTVLDIQLRDGSMELSQWGGPRFRPTNPKEILVVGQLDADGPRGIYVYDLATGGIRTIVEPAGYVHDVSWSPTGEHISYDLKTDESNQARVVAADGSGDRALDNAPGTTGHHQVSPWSNDGNRIVIYRAGESEADAQTVVVSTSGDGEPVELACGPTKDIECAGAWIWSPDDSTLIGTKYGEPTTYQQADPNTGQVTELGWDGLDLGTSAWQSGTSAWQRLAP